MIERITYKNHMNETIELGVDNIYANKSDIHDFSWSVVSKNNRISSFKKGIVKKTIPLIVKANSKAECISLKNRLFELCEKDVLAVKPGRLIIGDYYMNCYVTESKKTEYKDDMYMSLTITVQTDMPYWIRESTTGFNYGDVEYTGGDLDFNRDYPYDYMSNVLGKQLENSNFVPSNFRMIIYGPCIEPSVTVNGHVYGIDVELEANEYIQIDSTEKTIVMVQADGTNVNCFSKRDKDSYIFEKMPVGTSNISSSADFKFDIVLLEERGEPKWI